MITRSLCLSLALAVAVPSTVHALSCIKPSGYWHLSAAGQLRHRMQGAVAVFAGRFIDEQMSTDAIVFKFEVLRVWRGQVASKEAVTFSTVFGAAPQYVSGEVYLVIASGESGQFQNNLEECDNPIHVEQRGGRLAYPTSLGPGRAPMPSVPMR